MRADNSLSLFLSTGMLDAWRAYLCPGPARSASGRRPAACRVNKKADRTREPRKSWRNPLRRPWCAPWRKVLQSGKGRLLLGRRRGHGSFRAHKRQHEGRTAPDRWVGATAPPFPRSRPAGSRLRSFAAAAFAAVRQTTWMMVKEPLRPPASRSVRTQAEPAGRARCPARCGRCRGNRSGCRMA